MLKQGPLRAVKIEYADGIGCCIWYPFPDDKDDEGIEICFDFSFDDIDDMIGLLQQLKEAPAEKHEEK